MKHAGRQRSEVAARGERLPSVVVIVLNWNGPDDTIRCLQSLKSLSYSNPRVVVIDNASTDESVAKISERFPEILLLRTSSNLGFAGGNNVGITWALEQGADYVWLLNNDTTVAPDALDRMVAAAVPHPRIGAVGSVLYDMSNPDSIQTWGGRWITRITGRSRPHVSRPPQSKLHYLVAASMLLRADAVRDVGLLDDRFFMYWEDAEFGFRLRQAGWALAVADDACVWHKESASLGKKSPRLDAYSSHSAVLFYRQYRSIPLLPLVLNVVARMARRLLTGDWRRAKSVLTGTWMGLRATATGNPPPPAGAPPLVTDSVRPMEH